MQSRTRRLPSRLSALGCLSLLVAGTLLALPSTHAQDEPMDIIPGVEVFVPPSQIELVQASNLVRATQARSLFRVTGAGGACAIIDSGARISHIDFRGKIVAKRNFTTDDGGNPEVVTDGHGHGTNAAGVVAARAGVHTGIAPGANLVILKVANNEGRIERQAEADALQWVLDNHAAFKIRVVNMSISDPFNHANEAESPGDSFGILTKIRALRALGIPTVISAGNKFATFNGVQGMSWPAILGDSISVGAVFDANVGRDTLEGAVANTTAADRIVPWSQRLHSSVNPHSATDLFAPGALMTSSGNANDRAKSIFHGTSEAAPVVCGIILLLEQAARRSGIIPTVKQLEGWLGAGAALINDGDDENDNVPNTGLNFPRVDALGAMAAQHANLRLESPQLFATPTRMTLRRGSRGGLRLSNLGGGRLSGIVRVPGSRSTRFALAARRSIAVAVPAQAGVISVNSNGGSIRIPVTVR